MPNRSYAPIAFALFMLLALQAHSQAPEVVRSAFDKRYPGIESVTWEMLGQKYTAGFFNGEGQYQEDTFRENGKWLRSVIRLEETQLPEKVRNQWRSSVSDLEQLTTALMERTKCKTRYHLSYETSDLLINSTFNKKGKLLKKNSEPISIDD